MTVSDYVLQNRQTVVLTGDSITDCDCRGQQAPLGDGYVSIVAALSAAKYPERNIRFVNAGAGGDTIRHLAARWDRDVLAPRPDWLSISIGINDVWRQLDKGGPGVLIEEYAATYRELLERTRAKFSGCGLILMTTGVVGEEPGSEGRRLLGPYNDAIEQLAAKFNAFCVPIHARFAAAIDADRNRKWTLDGVHPNRNGHALMALTWLQTLGWAHRA